MTLNHQNLKIILLLRCFAIIGQIFTIAFVTYILKIPLPLLPLASIILIFIIFTLFTYKRYFIGLEVSQTELSLHIIIDIIILALLLFYTGGASNPFISLLILPLLVALFILPAKYCIFILTLSACFYITLSFFYHPIPHFLHYHLGSFFSLHLQGMFISYLIMSFTIAVFILRIRKNIRQNEEDIEYLVNQALINKNLERIALIAASYSHKVNTPLNTIYLLTEMLLRQLEEKNFNASNFKQDLSNIKEETEQASKILKSLLDNFSKNSSMQMVILPIEQFLNEFKELWNINKIDNELIIKNQLPAHFKLKHCELIQEVLTCFCDNAYEADATEIILQISRKQQNIEFSVKDNGTGINKEIQKNLGKAFYSSKTSKIGERGIGFFIAKKIIEKLDGEIILEKTNNKGTEIKFYFPLL